MPEQPSQPLRRTIRQEQQRLSATSYPGDLAHDTMQERPRASLFWQFRIPALVTAALIIGASAWVAMLWPSTPPNNASPTARAQPAPPAFQPDEQDAVEPMPPTVEQTAATKLPEIDRGLLPLQRAGQATWLASVKLHKQQIDKQARFAEHPNPGKRMRPTLSAPTRRTIGRITARPLSLKPAPKPERTS
ncbi:MAG: hypothetical protein KTR15_02315 [Phycisphaeraceae bacterium]|nr:hypothetical protein [Phycisphaeraceae bacterium]